MTRDNLCVGVFFLCFYAQMSLIWLRGRRPGWSDIKIATISGLLCLLAAGLPRAVGTGTTQPATPSIVLAVVGTIAAAVVVPGFWRVTAIGIHFGSAVLVSHLFVELVLDGGTVYVVPDPPADSRTFAPLWHTPLTGVFRRIRSSEFHERHSRY